VSLPVVSYEQKRDGSRILNDCVIYDEPLTGCRFIVWAGFKWDGCSIPRWLWSVAPPFSLSELAGLLHDFIYRYGGRLPEGNVVPYRTIDRATADRIFLETMRLDSVPKLRRYAAFHAVRQFGGRAWRG
jgi:hypothetical protein